MARYTCHDRIAFSCMDYGNDNDDERENLDENCDYRRQWKTSSTLNIPLLFLVLVKEDAVLSS